MKTKVTIAGILVVILVIFGGRAFLENTMQYSDFTRAKETGRRVPVRGQWVRDKGCSYDPQTNRFSFYMRDTTTLIVKVVFDGPKPNNFDLASHIVATGRFEDDYFHATKILTKCPSKYEGTIEDKKKTSS